MVGQLRDLEERARSLKARSHVGSKQRDPVIDKGDYVHLLKTSTTTTSLPTRKAVQPPATPSGPAIGMTLLLSAGGEHFREQAQFEDMWERDGKLYVSIHCRLSDIANKMLRCRYTVVIALGDKGAEWGDLDLTNVLSALARDDGQLAI
jgi:hypothetical protein